jgi:hypothetical protein
MKGKKEVRKNIKRKEREAFSLCRTWQNNAHGVTSIYLSEILSGPGT